MAKVAEVVLLTYDRRAVPVKAEVFHRGTFAVHGMLLHNDRLSKESWALTHVPSGWSIARFLSSRAAAIRLMRRLKPLADWSKVKGQEGGGVSRAASKRIVAAIKAALEGAR